MEALRIVTTPVNHQLIIDLPISLDNQTLEVIVLPTSPSTAATRQRRKPSPLLAGSVVMLDDLVIPAVPEADWEALK